MKIISIIATFFLCFIFDTVKAQVVKKHSHHLYLGYSFRNSFNSWRKGWFAGPVLAGYRYAIGKRLTLGTELGYGMGKTDAFSFTGYQSSPPVILSDRVRYSVYAVSFRLDYHYINRTKLDIYSGLSIEGYWKFQNYDEYSAYNSKNALGSLGICVVGGRYMVTPKIGVYSELGFRYLGRGVVGVSTRL